ncbi:MAG: thioredoxin domain-containing protein, partial [Gammaproteobacteria bacterium]|nr:thioredoxin domain-containing protein [Gammaproteobacteria bacterium]
FEDEDNGGFYFTGHQHEDLILRQKNYADDAIPSGNGIAALALLKLGYLLANTHYLSVAERTIKTSFNNLNQAPLAHATLIQALDTYLNNGITTIIIRGDEKTAKQWQSDLNKRHKPQMQHFYMPDEITLPIELVGKKSQNKTCAYICQGTNCLSPVYTLEEILKTI